MRLSRLTLALVAYAALGALTWLTITDEKLRLATFLILALFAVKSILRCKDLMHPDDENSK